MMSAESIVLAGYLTEAAGFVLLASLLWRFFVRLGRPYLMDWSLSWASIAAGQAGAAVAIGLHETLSASHPLRLAATFISLCGAFFQAAWMLLGARELIFGGRLRLRHQGWLFASLVAVALVATFAWAFDPAAVQARVFMRLGVRALVVGAAFITASAVLWRRFGARRGARRLACLAFLVYGVEQLAFLGFAGMEVPPAATAFLVFVDIFCLLLLGLATITWLLDEEHSRLTEATRQIEQLAFYDMVTGLPNRKLFLDRLRGFIDRNERTGERAAVLFLDLDHFKRVNDSYGHDVGDLLLAAVGERLRRTVREGDTVARLGGDEFVLLFPGLASAGEAESLARSLLDRLEGPFRIENSTLYVGASVGISLFPEDGPEALTLLRKADTAMYRAKEKGRGAYSTYSRELSEKSQLQLALETDLRSAIEHEELLLHYQPIVESASGEIVGVEALVRWQHPERGLLPPKEFLPLAEASGLSQSISDWVVRRATREVGEWGRRYRKTLRLAVNLTARAFDDPQLIPKVERALADAGLEPHELELEITETMALLHAGDPASTLSNLRQRGVRVAVDDFGTGYSSLSYLRDLAIDTLKLDSSFIHDLGHRVESSKIVGALISLAHGLHIEVIAEGVEEEQQMALLAMLLCDRMQGYLFSRPLAAREFEALLSGPRPFAGTSGGPIAIQWKAAPGG